MINVNHTDHPRMGQQVCDNCELTAQNEFAWITYQRKVAYGKWTESGADNVNEFVFSL